jgi:glutathione reductase (NADPH)
MAKEYDLIVIGTGVAASKIAQTCRNAGWQVAVVDRRHYGGTCGLRGCDPKKLLWGVAEAVEQAPRFAQDGVAGREISLSWPDLIRFKRSFLEGASQAVEKSFRTSGIETLHGRAHFVDPGKLAIDGHTARARHFVIASGSTPASLPIPGAEHLLTSDDFMELNELPDTLIFVGGGYISFEDPHVAARAGCKVMILHGDERPLAQIDRDMVDRLINNSRRAGIDIRLNSPVEGINRPFEVAGAVHGAGRVPDIDDLDLAAGSIEHDGHRLRLNRSLQSICNPAVYAAGAAAAGPMLTPVSELDADVVGENLVKNTPQRQPDYNGVPSVVFTIPPLASVGIAEDQARAQHLRFRVAGADISGWYSARRVQGRYGSLQDPHRGEYKPNSGRPYRWPQREFHQPVCTGHIARASKRQASASRANLSISSCQS